MLTYVILTATNGELKDTQFVLDGLEQVLIGRSSACTLQLDDPTVSRRHCLIDAGGEAVWVRDLESLNGTFVNGQRVGERPENGKDSSQTVRPIRELHDGDRLNVGKQTFWVHLVSEEEAADKELIAA